VGTRSTGGSSVGSGSARSQTDGGSEAASVDNFNTEQDDTGKINPDLRLLAPFSFQTKFQRSLLLPLL
jgi:hypothetical protein